MKQSGNSNRDLVCAFLKISIKTCGNNIIHSNFSMMTRKECLMKEIDSVVSIKTQLCSF